MWAMSIRTKTVLKILKMLTQYNIGTWPETKPWVFYLGIISIITYHAHHFCRRDQRSARAIESSSTTSFWSSSWRSFYNHLAASNIFTSSMHVTSDFGALHRYQAVSSSWEGHYLHFSAGERPTMASKRPQQKRKMTTDRAENAPPLQSKCVLLIGKYKVLCCPYTSN